MKTIRSAHEIFRPYFCLDRPEQPARLVEVRVVGPAAERRKAQHARPRAAAAVVDAVGARAVPRHADEERTVVAEVRRPPVLRRRHHRLDVLLHGVEIEGLELFGVVERLAHRIARRVIRVEDVQVQLIRPPVAVRPAAGASVAENGHFSSFSILTLTSAFFVFVVCLLLVLARRALAEAGRWTSPGNPGSAPSKRRRPRRSRSPCRRPPRDRGRSRPHSRRRPRGRRLDRSNGGGCRRRDPRSEPASRRAECAGEGLRRPALRGRRTRTEARWRRSRP